MTGLSKITDKILAEAKSDAEKTLAAADAECKIIAADYKNRAEKIKKDIEERCEREAAAIISRAKSSAAMDERNIALGARSDLVDKAFRDARRELEYLPDDKYLDLLTSMLISVVTKQAEDEKISRETYGEEDAPVVDTYEILLSERDLAKHGGALLGNLRRRFVGNNCADIVSKLRVSDTPAKIDGGLVLRCGDIEINSSISMIFEQMRPKLEARVSRILFDNQ